jgi:hypothetical protein
MINRVTAFGVLLRKFVARYTWRNRVATGKRRRKGPALASNLNAACSAMFVIFYAMNLRHDQLPLTPFERPAFFNDSRRGMLNQVGRQRHGRHARSGALNRISAGVKLGRYCSGCNRIRSELPANLMILGDIFPVRDADDGRFRKFLPQVLNRATCPPPRRRACPDSNVPAPAAPPTDPRTAARPEYSDSAA